MAGITVLDTILKLMAFGLSNILDFWYVYMDVKIHAAGRRAA